MHVCIYINQRIPAVKYGGSERVAVWLGRALVELGHKVTFIAKAGSKCDWAPLLIPAEGQALLDLLPGDVDIVHSNSGGDFGDRPILHTMHGNSREAKTLHPNTVFVSRNHAERHNATAFVHNCLDPTDYGEPDLAADSPAKRGHLVFLGNAKWNVKNVVGAIRVARKAGIPIDVLGGVRFNVEMGFRFTFDPNARFKGMVGGERKNRLLRRGRGMVFPVRWDEPFGIAVPEAMVFGLPVFATPYGSLPELVPEQCGVLSNRADVLADAARNAHTYDRRAIHQWCIDNFHFHRMAEKYLTYYQRILDGETLHPEPIQAPPTRQPDLFEWVR